MMIVNIFLLCGLLYLNAEGKRYLIETKTAQKTPKQILRAAPAKLEESVGVRRAIDPDIYDEEIYQRRGLFDWMANIATAVTAVIGPEVEPSAPNVSDIHFWLFTNLKGLENPVEVELSADSLLGAGFNPDHPTVIISHGFTSDGLGHGRPYAEAYLQVGDFNVFTIDWKALASWESMGDYFRAAGNTRIVGDHSAKLVALLAENGGLQNLHLVGHSLGAHVVGLIGKKVQELGHGKLPRITGLDPAQPGFDIALASDRLDKGDADFVDIIHTNSGSLFEGSLSILQKIGHMDFYPFGGKHQPGCQDVCLGQDCSHNILYDLMRGGCSHGRATEYFVESILAQKSGNTFLAWHCDNWAKFKAGGCCRVPEHKAIMGHGAKMTREGKYWLNVKADQPFSMHSDADFC